MTYLAEGDVAPAIPDPPEDEQDEHIDHLTNEEHVILVRKLRN